MSRPIEDKRIAQALELLELKPRPSYGEIADKVGLSRSTVSNIAAGRVKVKRVFPECRLKPVRVKLHVCEGCNHEVYWSPCVICAALAEQRRHG
jgi:hypothetical protein